MSTAIASGIEIEQISGAAFDIEIGGHHVVVDQPEESGGDDLGPTPSQLFVAALAACSAHYAYSYLRAHGLPDVGIAAGCTYEWSSDAPPRISAVDIRLTLPADLPPERLPAVLRAASRCAVHSSIDHGVEVRLTT